ncbi:MAG: hypothetical protein KDA25_06280, partial [Phycisphaerales bacterium]|nr:hypothetical protein [Phycisphaerales bacterium]
MFGFRTHGAWAAALVGLTASILVAGPVVIDSDTAVGPDDRTFDGLDIVVRGATLTIDGTHAFASLTLERNGSNQPGILRHTAAFSARGVNGTVLDVSGDVLVQGADRALVGSRIDLDGRGYPGTMGPGAGGNSSNGSWGSGGGGHGGAGGNGAGGFATPGGGTYGSVTMPDEFGSGAGSYLGNASAAGGGAIRLIVGGTLTVDGTITAGGAALSSTAGAGGSIWIDAATVAGTGIMRANGANGQNGSWGGGGGGRIAVIANTLTFDGDLTACGGSGARGGAGTIYRNIGGVRTVIVDNCGNVGENTEF